MKRSFFTAAAVLLLNTIVREEPFLDYTFPLERQVDAYILSPRGKP